MKASGHVSRPSKGLPVETSRRVVIEKAISRGLKTGCAQDPTRGNFFLTSHTTAHNVCGNLSGFVFSFLLAASPAAVR